MKTINKNIQVISAIICAILMIGFGLILNKSKDGTTLFMVLGAMAAIQVVMSFFLANKNSQKKKRV